MTQPFYVSPEQLMRDRSDFARKGIARGRAVVALRCADGLAFVAENPSSALHKLSELHDRIGYAAVGKYNEFENLRVAGVRLADSRAYSYDRRDVTARMLANAYAQTLGAVFIQQSKPLEVEVVLGEVAQDPAGDQMFVLRYDGSVADERDVVVMGGRGEQVAEAVRAGFDPTASLADAVRLAVGALERAGDEQPRRLEAASLEVAALLRERLPRRSFVRYDGDRLAALLGRGDGAAVPDPPHAPPPGPDQMPA